VKLLHEVHKSGLGFDVRHRRLLSVPKKDKPVRDMTNDELADLVFPKAVKKELQRMATEPKAKKPKKG
jgi:hypothetical protein